VDGKLAQFVKEGRITETDANNLMGRTAIAQVRLAYQLFEKEFCSERYQALKAKGARLQRPLWASTSTKKQGIP